MATPDLELLRDIFRLAPIGIGIVDLDGRTIHTNDRLRELLGYSPQEFASLHFERITHPDDVAANLAQFGRMAAGEIDRFVLDKRMLARDGRTVWTRLTVSLIRDADDRPELAIGMLEDISEQQRLQAELTETLERYRLVVDRVPAVVYVSSPEPLQPWPYISPQVEPVLGFTPAEWLADPGLWRRQVHPDDLAQLLATAEQLIADGVPTTRTMTYRLRHRDGHELWIRDQMAFDHEADGRPVLRGVWLDVTREKQLEQRLEHQAFHDGLTGLPNRDLFTDRVAQRLRQRAPDERAGTLLYLDLDDFKQVNDQLGHDVGDALLRSVADRLRDGIRAADTAARLGGDEFGVLLGGLDDPDEVEATVARLAASLEQPHELPRGTLTIGTSIGITDLADAASVDEALRNADLAMYAAKNEGKGGLARYRPAMLHSARDRTDLRAALRHALDSDGLRTVERRVVDLRTSTVAGSWLAPAWRDVAPAGARTLELTALADEVGEPGQLGWWLLEQGLTRLALRRSGGGAGQLWLEVPRGLLRSDGFAAALEQRLAVQQLEPAELGLAVDAEALVDTEVRRAIGELADVGVVTLARRVRLGSPALPLLAGCAAAVGLDEDVVGCLLAEDRPPTARAFLALLRTLVPTVVAEQAPVGTTGAAVVLRGVGIRLVTEC